MHRNRKTACIHILELALFVYGLWSSHMHLFQWEDNRNTHTYAHAHTQTHITDAAVTV